MEAAVRSYLHTMLADYVTGLNNTEITLPLTLRNMQLKTDAVNKEMVDVPFDLTEGLIGFVSLKPNTNAMGLYNGTFEVTCTDIKLNLSYSMSKMMKNMMGGNDYDDGSGYYEPSVPGSPQNMRQPPRPPPENVPPCYCQNHDTSAKRQKDPAGPQSIRCETCSVEFQTTYIGARLCQYCSNKQARCIICGDGGATASGYIPATQASKLDAGTGGGPGGGPNDRDRPSYGGPSGRGVDRRGPPDGDLPPPPPPVQGRGPGGDRRDGPPGGADRSQRYGQDGGREQGPYGRQDDPLGGDAYGTRLPQGGPPGGGGPSNVYGAPPPGPNPNSFRGQGPPQGPNPNSFRGQGPPQGAPASFNPQQANPLTSFSQRGPGQGPQHETRWNPGPGPAGPPRRAVDDDDEEDETFVGFLRGIFDFRGGTCAKPNAVESVDVYHDDMAANPRGSGGGGQRGYR